jgi:hypothetical protein
MAGLAAVGTLCFAATAMAETQTFASYNQVGQGSSLVWGQTGGTSGSLYTSTNGAIPSAVGVSFSFLSPQLADIGALSASFTMLLTANEPAFSGFGFTGQSGLSGSFSFIYNGPGFTVGSTFYGSGTNLLTGTVSDSAIFGQTGSTSGALSGSTGSGSSISFSSDVLAFAPGSEYDLALSLTQIAGGLSAAPGSALNNFTAAATGSFSANPAPDVIALPVPEAATWALMLVGFGGIGGALRSRRSTTRLANI